MNWLKYIGVVLLALVGVQTVMAQSDRNFIRSGNRLYRQQNYAKAEIEYRKALAKNPRNPQTMYNLGCALLMQQKDSAAVVQFQNAGRTETAKMRKAMVYHNIGVACQKHQLFAEAIQAYEESLRNNPSDNETRYNLVLCKRQQKKQKQDNKNNQQQKKKQKQNDNKQDNKKNQQKDQQKQQPKSDNEKMSKDNAEQLLNYAEQEEKATQQRLNRNKVQPQRRRLEKNW
ncbi:MAG: tetratricopeptide repeat protein [Prevotella sp.]|nr:tetratricopeptide repeat protein [Prevotella sp.]